MPEQRFFSPDYIQRRLNKLNPNRIDHPAFKKSAILIPLFPDPSEQLFFIMTARSRRLKKHAGEMSFPGGSFEPKKDQTLKDTALRETYEEIGITPESIKVLGSLNDFPTITGFIIRPFIGYYGDFKDARENLRKVNAENINFEINNSEVSELIEIPLNYLFTPGLFSEKKFPHPAIDFSILSFDYYYPKTGKKYTIWGASAHILAEFLSIVFDYEVRSKNYRRPNIEELIIFREKYLKTNRK